MLPDFRGFLGDRTPVKVWQVGKVVTKIERCADPQRRWAPTANRGPGSIRIISMPTGHFRPAVVEFLSPHPAAPQNPPEK